MKLIQRVTHMQQRLPWKYDSLTCQWIVFYYTKISELENIFLLEETLQEITNTFPNQKLVIHKNDFLLGNWSVLFDIFKLYSNDISIEIINN
jgi:hypothetical protein